MPPFRLTPPKIKLTENDVEKACLDVLRLHGFYPVRLQSGVLLAPDRLCATCRNKARWIRVGEPGIPDYVMARFFLEVKRPGGSLSDAQKEKIEQLEKHWKLETAVVESVEELIDWLARYGK